MSYGRTAALLPPVDEAELLKTYHLDTLDPQRWQDDPTAHLNAAEVGSAAAAAGAASLLADEPDALGLRSGILSAPRDMRAQTLLASKAFDAKLYLSTLHPDATFADLSRAVHHLQDSISQRSEALKVLVQDNFDRFVAVKATTDGVHREMKESEGGPLRPDADYGVRELKEILAQASARADQVFMPVLENNLKAAKLRSTLGVFERSRFFFNLPGSLAQSVAAGRYDAALRDYKKGKYMLDSKPGQLLAFNTAGAQAGDPRAQGNAKQQAQQKRVFAKVWDAVEATMQEMQDMLFALLREPKRGVEEQERTIEVLLELEPTQDPVAVFLESQHNHIRTLMRKSYDASVAQVEGAAVMANLQIKSDKDRARDIQVCVRQLSRAEQSFERNIGAPGWKAIHELVRNLSDTLVQTLPSFWRVCKNSMEGKIKSRAAGLQAQSKAWASESVEAYIALLSQFFCLTDVALLARQPLSPLASWVPAQTCSTTAAYYMRAALTELNEAVTDLVALGIGSTPGSLKNLLANLRFAFTETLCQLWQADAKMFFMLEDWSLNPDVDATTLYLKELAAFHKSNARAAYFLAGGRDGADTTPRSSEPPPPAEFTGRIKAAFLDALYAFLDGLVHLAFSEFDPLDPNLTTSQKVVEDSRLTVDVQELDTRILLSVTNLAHLKNSVVPGLTKQFQDAFQVSMSEDVKTIEEVAQQLDEILFTDFVKRKGDVVADIFRNGILSSGINWQAIPKPSEVHPFIYEALLSLVQVHAQVRSVAKPLVQRTISSLLDDLVQVVLESFGLITRFGMGGMLQATLEIEFMHQTLAQYLSPAAEATLKQIYETISRKYVREGAAGAAAEAEMLQRELEGVKRTLVSSRKATALEFLCFRKPREERDPSRVKTSSSSEARAEPRERKRA